MFLCFVICLYWDKCVTHKESSINLVLTYTFFTLSEYSLILALQLFNLHPAPLKDTQASQIALTTGKWRLFISDENLWSMMINSATRWNKIQFQKDHIGTSLSIQCERVLWFLTRYSVSVFTWVLTSGTDRAFHCNYERLQQVLLTNSCRFMAEAMVHEAVFMGACKITWVTYSSVLDVKLLVDIKYDLLLVSCSQVLKLMSKERGKEKKGNNKNRCLLINKFWLQFNDQSLFWPVYIFQHFTK